MRFRATIAVGTLLCCAAAAQAQSAEPLTAHRTGEFDAVLSVRSTESEASRWAARFQFPGNLENWDYDLATESSSLYVPPDYDPRGEPYGVLVWVSASDDGSIPADFRAVLDEHRLIWIGPNNAGNARHLFPRAGLVLDATENVKRFYNVDPDRIFVSGLSGGGKVAAYQAVAYPDVFAGGYPLIGMLSYLEVPLRSRPGQFVQRFARPSEDLLEHARRQPLVIMTGSGDFNREECRLTAEAYETDGFSDLHLLDIDGMGHEMPTGANFGLGLDLLLRQSTTN